MDSNPWPRKSILRAPAVLGSNVPTHNLRATHLLLIEALHRIRNIQTQVPDSARRARRTFFHSTMQNNSSTATPTQIRKSRDMRRDYGFPEIISSHFQRHLQPPDEGCQMTKSTNQGGTPCQARDPNSSLSPSFHPLLTTEPRCMFRLHSS